MLDPLLEAIVDEECANYKPGFESLEAFRKRHKNRLKKSVEENLKLLSEGLDFLLASSEWSDEEKLRFQAIGALEGQLQEVMEKAFTKFEEGQDEAPPTIGALLGLDEAFYLKAFNIANKALDEGKIEEAKKAFMALSQINPQIFQFAEGLGHVFIKEEKYEEALVVFLLALEMVTEEEMYRVGLLVANMFIVLEQNDKAKAMAESIVKEIGDNPAYVNELAMANELLESLND